MKPIRLMSGFFTVGIWTLLSRVMGFRARCDDCRLSWVRPRSRGVSGRLFPSPTCFRRFFAEGAFNMAFVPMFSKKLESGDDPEKFAQDAFVGMAFF